ncbi:DNA polymerase III subunit chi [Aestuariispira insulae]|uniref:DNA polymerase III chi subunit n=1 Tax=Aestuariispira insulae TaxID=1461337 RepID=A0A3D9HVJ3_9PROT|nr:DNA polymerase III subunit chi [Aestuariispira insulae]RED53512.1 DNA polymerase III chi subunit [Aestuariispira insulae]
METRYYHLQRKTLEQILPQLLQMTLERNWRAVVMVGSPERVEFLNRHLWTFNDRSFIPHGAAEDGEAELQPVWLTSEEENPNNSNVLFLVDGADSADLEQYELVCRLFDGNDDLAVADARKFWKAQKDAGHRLTYWQQTDQGGWTKKAEANSPE